MKQQAWEFFKYNFKWLAGAALILVLYFQGCFKQFEAAPPTVTHDTTVIVHKYEAAPYIPPIINVLPAKPTVINKPEYQPDTSSIEALRKQFNELVRKHTEQNIVNDSLKIDTLGYVNIKDTISENKIAKRSYNYDIKERLITTTITQPYKLRNQVFIGGGINIPLDNPLIRQVAAKVLFENKGGSAIELSPNYNFKTKEPGAEISYLKLIRIKR